MPGRHHGEAAERLPQLSRYSSEVPLSGLLLLPQMRFSLWSPAPIPASLRWLIPTVPTAKSYAAVVLLGLVHGLGAERMRRRFHTCKKKQSELPGAQTNKIPPR